jgi:NAD(P)-dependent dehydrogenase (short-subunit alcohol dehydrogenase family)
VNYQNTFSWHSCKCLWPWPLIGVPSQFALDILVNNAGVYNLLPLEEVTEEDFHRHFNINVLGLRRGGSCGGPNGHFRPV